MTSEIELWPAQKRALTTVSANLKTGRVTSFIIGQRGGKTQLLQEIAKLQPPHTEVILIAPTVAQGQANVPNLPDGTDYQAASVFLKYLQGLTGSQISEMFSHKLILIEEAPWVPQSKAILSSLISAGVRSIVVVGSMSDSITTFTDLGTVVDEHTGATWDWNPVLAPEDFLDQFEENFDKAARDFGLKHAKNPELAAVLNRASA